MENRSSSRHIFIALLADMSTAKTHEVLKVLVDGDMVAIQPAAASGSQAETLSVALASGQVVRSEAPLLGPSAETVLAIVGMFSFKAGAVLAAVTQAAKVRKGW